MEIVISEQAQKHIEYWKKTKNLKVQVRIIELKNAIMLNPFVGIGNPEALKHKLSEKWSRRIDKVNCFVYNVLDDKLYIYSLKGHYE
jgi:toxin YoeB